MVHEPPFFWPKKFTRMRSVHEVTSLVRITTSRLEGRGIWNEVGYLRERVAVNMALDAEFVG
jgi:hypothetical protein